MNRNLVCPDRPYIEAGIVTAKDRCPACAAVGYNRLALTLREEVAA
jgi:hypothetical protein